jgi:hypothetical protein
MSSLIDRSAGLIDRMSSLIDRSAGLIDRMSRHDRPISGPDRSNVEA